MDIKVALSIYNKPWLIEPNAALSLLTYIESSKQSGEFDLQRLKSFNDDDGAEERQATQEAVRKLFAIDGVAVAPTNRWGLREFKGFEGNKVAVIQLLGPMMKADYCGDLGTASLRQLIRQAAEARSVETILLFGDTPGGTVDGTQAFSMDFAEARKKKNTITFVDDMLCSAGYWAGSPAEVMIAGAETTMIGSIGTMMSWWDGKEVYEREGFKFHEFYATRSTDKNRIFRDAAAGTDAGKKELVEQFLDPANDVFLRSVQENRAGKIDLKKEDVLTGKLYYAADAKKYGLVDDIKSFEQTLNIAMGMAPKKNKKNYVMSANNNGAFQNVLIAAEAQEFQTVEGGFLLEESHLNAIDAQLSADKTAIRTLTKANQQLEAAASAANAETLQAELTAANEKLATLEAANATLTSQLEEAKKGGAMFLNEGGAGAQDKGGVHEGAMEQEPAHVTAAREMLPPVARKKEETK